MNLNDYKMPEIDVFGAVDVLGEIREGAAMYCLEIVGTYLTRYLVHIGIKYNVYEFS